MEVIRWLGMELVPAPKGLLVEAAQSCSFVAPSRLGFERCSSRMVLYQTRTVTVMVRYVGGRLSVFRLRDDGWLARLRI
jgi:hypothetical protein